MKSLKDLFSTIDLAFIGTIAVAYAYGLFYCFSMGTYKVYGLPTYFIELDKNALTANILFIVLMIVMLFFVWFTTNELANKGHLQNKSPQPIQDLNSIKVVPIKRKISYIIALILLVIFGLSFFKSIANVFIDFSIERLIMFILMPVVLSLLFSLILRFKLYLYPIIGLFLLTFVGSFLFGEMLAQERENYFIIHQGNHKEYVVLRKFQQQFIIAPVDLKKKTITPKFQLIDIKSEQDKKVEWELVHTGRLEVKNSTN